MINSDTPRTSYTLSSDATTSDTYATPAPIYSADDVSVYVNNVLKTISSPQQYSVTVATDNTATVSFTSSHLPVSGDIITIVRSLAYLQQANFVNNDALDIENVETGLDKITIMSQQLNDGRQYSFKFDTSLSGTTAFNSNADTASTLNVNKANRLNKALKFDANGDLGVSTNDPDAQVADATAQATTATTKATEATRAATNSKNYAQTAENSQASVFADVTSASTSNDGYSALHYREKAKEWAGDGTSYPEVTNDSGSNTGEYSAKAWAAKPSGTVDGSTASAKVSAAAAAASATSAADTSQANAIVFSIALG